jgi:hypothetical protein
VAVLAALVAGGCDSSSDDEGSSDTYAVLNDAGWTLQEAVDPPPDDRLASGERPPLDWYSEHVRMVGSEGQRVRLSGHRATLEEAITALVAVGFGLDPIAIEGWDGVGGEAPADPAGPALILFGTGATTFMALSYELSLEELAAVVAEVETVSEGTWVERGGVVRDSTG